MPKLEDLPELVRTAELAKVIGGSKHVINMSRCTGELFGVKPPKHIKVGKNIFYRKKDIKDWLEGLGDGKG